MQSDLVDVTNRKLLKTRYEQFTARHHSAHAVVGEVLDVAYGGLTMTDTCRPHLDPQLVNRKVIDRLDDHDAAWPFARRAAMVTLAGHVAEFVAEGCLGAALGRFTSELANYAMRLGSAEDMLPDYVQAFSAVDTLVEDFPVAIAEVVAATFKIVEANWRSIEIIARELLVRKHVSPAQVKRLVGNKLAVDEIVLAEGGVYVG